jgi:hypothetical protein
MLINISLQLPKPSYIETDTLHATQNLKYNDTLFNINLFQDKTKIRFLMVQNEMISTKIFINYLHW